MFDDESDVWPERGQHIFDEKLDREGSVFVEPQHAEKDCNNPEERGCAPDEYPDDPFAIDNRPGTPDDVTYSYGLEHPSPADQHIVLEGGVHQSGPPAPDEEREFEPGEREERDAWRHQRALIEEDADSPKIPVGMSDEDAERVMGAMGDGEGGEASEDVAEASATGSTNAEEHGGFPDTGL